MSTPCQVPQQSSLWEARAAIRLPKMCAHISPAVTWAAPCNPDLGRAVLSYPHSPPSAQRNTRSELIHPTDVFSRDTGKRILCRSALTANMHNSASSTKITDPYDRNGLRVQPSWPSHISLYIIIELPRENNLSVSPASAGNSGYPPCIISSRASSLTAVPTVPKWLRDKHGA